MKKVNQRMSNPQFNREDLLNYLFGSNNQKNEMIKKVIHALDAKLNEQVKAWRRIYDKHGEVQFVTTLSSELARQDPDAIRGVCLALILRQIKAVNIDGERTDSSGIGDTTDVPTDEQ